VKRLLAACALVAAFSLAAALGTPGPAAKAVAAHGVLVVRLEGAVSPVMDGALREAIERVERERFAALLIEIDTPGGLESSMRDMVKRLLASERPVIAWVTPSGGHAASAGVFIVMAADVAAMSPGTNIGAATPISMQGAMDSTLARKVTNDASAFARTVAAQRGRNAAWAERAVREAISASETEAVQLHVVDFIAGDEADLLAKVEGRPWRRGERVEALHVRGLPVEHVEPGFRQRLLGHLADQNIAYLLMMLGFYGVLFELQNPGAILPGIVGGICLVLAFFSLSTLPVNAAGVALLVLGLGFLLAEIKVHRHGMLAVGGSVALALGALLLFQAGTVHVALPVVLGGTAVTVAFFLLIVGAGLRARRLPVRTGEAGLRGRLGTVVETLAPSGRVRVDGEVWNAMADAAIETGAEVEILGMKGLTLRVRPAHKEG